MNLTSNPPPLACNPSALGVLQRQKHAVDTSRLLRRVTKVLEMPNGLALQLANERPNLLLAAEWIIDESKCCPFLDFDLHIKAESRILEMRLTGPEGTGEFLMGELPALLRVEEHASI